MSDQRPSSSAPSTPDAAAPSKAYRPSEVEPQVSAKWEKSGAFHADPQRVLRGEAKPYSIVIPPPNVTGVLHLGHALNNTLQDILIRAHRMMGYEALWMPGTDHAGIATQAVVEKRLLKEEGKRRKDFTREEFIARVQTWKDEYESRITQQLKAMGCSCDFERQRFTMDDICAKAVREAFFILFRDGLIYRGKRLVNWDTALQTAVADDECYEEEIDTNFWYMKYPLEKPVRLPDGSTIDHVTVATTRPETYLGDTAVALNPRDPRAAALVGKHVILPIVTRRIPIVADDYVVLPEAMATTDEEKNDPKAKYASGFLKVTPAHDQNDNELYQRHKATIDANSAGNGLINMMSPDGKVSDQHGWTDIGAAKMFVGLKMAEARKRVVEEFSSQGLLAETRPYRQSVKRSERSQAIIEPFLSDQWYVKVTDDKLAGAANRALVKSQRSDGAAHTTTQPAASTDAAMEFHPARYAKTFEHWHSNIRDWCISRQLWWGHRIPVWTTENLAFGEGAEEVFLPLLKRFEAEGRLAFRGKKLGRGFSELSSSDMSVCVRDNSDGEVFSFLRSNRFEEDPDVLDTWFSSALWPLSTMGWPTPDDQPETAGLLQAFNPTSVLSTAREIITLWVSRMTMMNRYLLPESWPSPDTRDPKPETRSLGLGRGPVPFHDVFIHAVVQDGEGRKMSKSLGNGVDPLDIIESHGADAMRFTLCQMTTQTQDVRMPVSKDSKTGKNTSPKFDLGRNFCNKLWNASKFALTFIPQDAASSSPSSLRPFVASSLPLPDRWLLSRLATTTNRVSEMLKDYEFSSYADAMYDLLWRDVCDWYLEAVKPTITSNPGQQAVLAHALDTILRLLHPITPFITEAIFEQVRGIQTAPIAGVDLGLSKTDGLLCTAAWPVLSPSLIDEAAEREFESLRSLVVAIRNVRADHKVLPKRRITLHLSASAAKTLALSPGFVETLGGLESVEIRSGASSQPANAVAFRALDEEMFLTNLADAIDAGAEKDRLVKELDALRKSEATLAGRLSNPGYVDRAPAKLVDESKAQLAKIRSEITTIEGKLASM